MNRRQRWMMQAVLAIVAGLLGWRLATEWQEADLRYSALANSAEQSAAGAPATMPEDAIPVEEIAAKNLFSADRNNDIPEPEEVSEAGPPPPRPIVLGTLKLGANYEALMSESESSGSGVRRVKQGEQIGAYRVVEIRAENVVIEYEGQTTTLAIYQSRRSVEQQRTQAGAPARPAGPVVVGTGAAPARASAPVQAAPSQPTGQPTGREIQDPKYGQYTRIFVEGNRRRVERTTPFGIQRWYEPLQPGDTQ